MRAHSTSACQEPWASARPLCFVPLCLFGAATACERCVGVCASAACQWRGGPGRGVGAAFG
eukprot:scaffold7123_cov119-Isochrysis_galbana.AAC.17